MLSPLSSSPLRLHVDHRHMLLPIPVVYLQAVYGHMLFPVKLMLLCWHVSHRLCCFLRSRCFPCCHHQVTACMQAMEGTDCALSKSATMKAMGLCETAGDVNAALSLFELAVQKGKADVEIFCKAMAACLGAGRLKVRASAFCSLLPSVQCLQQSAVPCTP